MTFPLYFSCLVKRFSLNFIVFTKLHILLKIQLIFYKYLAVNLFWSIIETLKYFYTFKSSRNVLYPLTISNFENDVHCVGISLSSRLRCRKQITSLCMKWDCILSLKHQRKQPIVVILAKNIMIVLRVMNKEFFVLVVHLSLFLFIPRCVALSTLWIVCSVSVAY